MIIRQAQAKDIPQVANLLYQVHDIHAKGRPDLFVLGERKYTDEDLAEIFSDAENRPVFVAEEAGKILGYAFCMFEEIEASRSRYGVKSLYIDDLCVDAETRGKGVGSRLYDHVVNYARAHGCDNITLNVWELNESARRFYEKKGLLPLKTVMEKNFKYIK